MLEALHNAILFIRSREGSTTSQKTDSLFNKGRWGFRYDPKHKEGWRRVAHEHCEMIQKNPHDFWRYLKLQSPAEQYALLELLSQPAFGREISGEHQPHMEPKGIGDLYTELIRTHFQIPSGSDEAIQQEEERKQEFIKQVWRLTIPQTALTYTVFAVTPDLFENPYSPDVLEYMQSIVNRMGEKARQDLGEQRIAQLQSLGVTCITEQYPEPQPQTGFESPPFNHGGFEAEHTDY